MRKNIKDSDVKIPKSFTIGGGRKITINNVEMINDGATFGNFETSLNQINIASKLTNGDIIEIDSEDKLRTYLHELVHVFQFFAGMEMDERTAQTFSNFMYEYIMSVEYDD